MKNKVFYLVVMISAILLLVSWANIGNGFDSQASMMDISGSYPRSEAPDFFADAKLFNDMYQQNVATSSRSWARDYPADAKIFYEEYLNSSLSSERRDIPDYPLDGKFFVEHWTETP